MEQNIEPKTATSEALQYQIEGPIGEGGYGTVYKAKQFSTGQTVALKKLKAREDIDEATKAKQIARFERETRLVAELNHPHIVQLLDKGMDAQGLPYAVFEYVEGETLKQYLVNQGSLSASEMAPLMSQLLDALVTAHEAGIVHRDLKPQNIMVTQTGAKPYVKILDFGIAAFTQEFRTADYRTLTFTKDVVGTPTYSAPEQLRGESPSGKSDLYAWGLILLECLTGVPIMDGESVGQVFQKQLAPTPVPLPPVLLDHPLGLLMRRVLEKNPRNRVADAQRLLKEFEAINFQTLSGTFEAQNGTGAAAPGNSATVENYVGFQHAVATRKQITVLCLQLQLEVISNTPIELEVLDALQKDQLQLCKDTAQRYGGTVTDPFVNHLLVYFGYPESTDTDARRAGKAALELQKEVAERSASLQEQHGLKAHLRLGLHSGTVLSQEGQLPQGAVPMIAFELAQGSTQGNILVSENSQRLLVPFSDLSIQENLISLQAAQPIPTYTLDNERESETGTALRPWSADRPMVGRDSEKQSAINIWKQSQERGQALIIHGQAGIGKSKLTHEVKNAVRAQGRLVRECRCLPEHQNNALYPFLTMLRHHWGLVGVGTDKEKAERLTSAVTAAKEDQTLYVPILASWLGIHLPEGAYEALTQTPDEQKVLLFGLLSRTLSHLDSDQPFLLVLEDLHWLDPTSTEFVTQLLKGLPEQPFLLLMTTRPNFTNPWSKEQFIQIDLETLPEEAVRALVESTLNQKDVDDTAIQYIADRTDGIPLFVEEMTSMLKESGYLIQKENRYHLAENIEDQSVPSTLADLLNARLDRMTTAKETAQLASAIGREFDYELLLKASGKAEETVLQDLDLLTKADLVFRQQRSEGQSYIFRHALIRDAAYDGMVTTHRKSVHNNLAVTIEQSFPEMLENTPMEPARHFAGAGNHERATELGNTAIQKQVSSSGNQEAKAISDTVRTWIGGLDDDIIKQTRLLDMGVNVSGAVMTLDGFGSQPFIALSNEIEASVQELNLLDQRQILDDLQQEVNQNEHPALHALLQGYSKEDLASKAWQEKFDKATEEATTRAKKPAIVALKEKWDKHLEGALYPERELQSQKAQFNKMLTKHYTAYHREATALGGELLAKSERKLESLAEKGDQKAYDDERIFIQQVYVHLAQAHWFLGELETAITLWEKGDALYNPETDGELMKPYGSNSRGNFLVLGSMGYLYRGYTDKALANAKKGLEYTIAQKDQAAIALAYNVLQIIYEPLGDMEALLHTGDKMHVEIEEHGWEEVFNFNFPKLIHHAYSYEPEKAKEYYDVFKSAQARLAMCNLQRMIGDGFVRKGIRDNDDACFHQAYKEYLEALDLCKESEEYISIPYIYTNLAKLIDLHPAVLKNGEQADVLVEGYFNEAIKETQKQGSFFNQLVAQLDKYESMLTRSKNSGTSQDMARLQKEKNALHTLTDTMSRQGLDTDYAHWEKTMNILGNDITEPQMRI